MKKFLVIALIAIIGFAACDMGSGDGADGGYYIPTNPNPTRGDILYQKAIEVARMFWYHRWVFEEDIMVSGDHYNLCLEVINHECPEPICPYTTETIFDDGTIGYSHNMPQCVHRPLTLEYDYELVALGYYTCSNCSKVRFGTCLDYAIHFAIVTDSYIVGTGSTLGSTNSGIFRIVGPSTETNKVGSNLRLIGNNQYLAVSRDETEAWILEKVAEFDSNYRVNLHESVPMNHAWNITKDFQYFVDATHFDVLGVGEVRGPQG